MSDFPRLSARDRQTLLQALEQGDLAPPYSEMALGRYVGRATARPLSVSLERLRGLGLTPPLLKEFLLLGPEPSETPRASLVWTGPEEAGSETRDTGVVVRELFATAEREVLIAGFAVYQGRAIFEVLARRMDADPNLRVRMFLNIERPYGDTTVEAQLIYEFARSFRDEQWPGRRLPEVYFDPRALELHERGKKRAALHAKCVLADRRRGLITSANLTEAAQDRNIELGVLLDDPELVGVLAEQFEALVARDLVRRVAGL